MPTLTVKRDRGWADKVRGYKILVDGRPVGVLKGGTSISCPISSGPHTVEARIDWCGSPKLPVEVGVDDCSVLVRSNLRGLRLLFAGCPRPVPLTCLQVSDVACGERTDLRTGQWHGGVASMSASPWH